MKRFNWKSVSGLMLAVICAAPMLQSCSKTPDVSQPEVPVVPKTQKEYAIFVTVGNATSGENYYTLVTGDLTKDTLISPVNSGIEPDNVTSWAYIYSVFFNGSFYFTQDGNIISKQQIVNGRYKKLGNVVAEAGSWQLGMMKTVFNDKGLNFLSWEANYNATEDVIEKNLYVLDTAAVTIKTKLPVKFPVPLFELRDNNGKVMEKKDIPITPSSFAIRDNKVFIGFYYNWMTKIDTAYMLVCDYPGLTNVKLLKDARLGHVSGAWHASSSSFTDENGDYYFSTISKDKKYGLLRIKKGATTIDPDYSYSLSELGNISGGATWGDYAGSDHHAYLKNGLAFMGSYIIDVRNKKVVKDLNSFGLGKVQITMDTYTENNNEIYVVLKTTEGRWYIGKYDVTANTLTKGVEIHSGIKGISRIGRIK
ncbi:DUF4374 domain-containing protein [Chitinophaga nivalis]|uniref:DUF4374 domain-containing protein n=1 Tax=Chitinophaga nivalis TaxID=2991709 RepID=A0ABT3IMC0_9BACT|nr:DUF4374 domain-containing protein [Chitinophaga nivalis]MCW3465192.1 DUF4374 domain-containing protein [Chitinophaga nivalis]MCW3485116.1 DUF4374 domain-containing protein [Chitinophaga nivalis]